jgi:DNA-binding MarR family transcriptional regulator
MLLGRAAALKDRLLDRQLMPLGITASQLKVLRIIRRGDDTAVALCRHLSIHSASMTRMLDRLERKGLIVRSLDDQDRRQVRLALTNKGEAISSVLPTMEIAAMNEFTASLTTAELLRLENLLEKMLSLKIGQGV